MRKEGITYIVYIAKEERMDLYPNMSKSELTTWAQVHGLESLLQIPARIVQNKVQEDHSAWLWIYKQSTIPLLELISRPTASGAANQKNAPRSFQEAGIEYLQQAKKNTQEAYEEEEELLRRTPSTLPAIESLWSRLCTLRARIRNVASPRKHNERLGHRIWVEENPPTIIYKEETQAWCGDNRWPEIRIDLQSSPTIMRCQCTHGKRGQCSIGLSAIDTVLLSLCDPSRNRQHQNLEHLLSTPRWSRQLEHFDKSILEKESEKGELGWRLKITKIQGVTLIPVLCSKTNSGDWKHKQIDFETLWQWVDSTQISKEEQQRIRLLWPEREDTLKGITHKHRQALHHMAISTLINHPRVFLGARAKSPISIQEMHLRIHAFTRNKMIHFQLKCGEHTIEAHEFEHYIQHRTAGGIWIHDKKEMLYVIDLSLKKQSLIRSILELQLPEEAKDELRKRIPKISKTIPLSLTEELECPSIPTNSSPIFQLELKSSQKFEVTAIVRPIHLARIPGEGEEKIYEYHQGDHVSGNRNLLLEINRLDKSIIKLSLNKNQKKWIFSEPNRILSLVDELRESNYPTEWIGTSITQAKKEDLKTKISFDSQGFTIDGSIDIDGGVPLTQLLIAVREHRPFINIHGAKWLALSTELRRNLLTLADAIQPVQEKLFLSQQHIPVVHSILTEAIKPTEWLEKVQKMEKPPILPSLESIKATLRPYQHKGYQWLFELSQWSPGACLADDMGLGKTIQTLSFLSTQEGPFLVVGPTSLAMNWYYETQKFCPDLSPSVYRGENRKNLLRHLRPKDLLITSYNLLTRDIQDLQNVKFSVFVLDEAQAIKNPQTARSKAAQKISADFILTLTGTPIENHLSDLWSLFRVTNPGLLGSQAQFYKRFIKDNRREALAQLLSPFLLRRLKSQVATDLPERIEIEDYIDLSISERTFYTKVYASVLSKLNFYNPEQRFQMLAALTKLRQISCHPRLVDPTFVGTSSKVERCIDLLLQMRAMNRKVLIFSQFVQLLQIVKSRAEQENLSYCYLDGSLSLEKREEQVETFQRGEKDCFFISLKAGGSGLNLTIASEVILLDPWWNPAVEAQAADRSHRIGQTQQVSIYRLISRNTIEASIINLHQKKKEVAAHLLQDRDQILSIHEIRSILTNPVSESIEKTEEETPLEAALKNENRNE